MHDSETSASWRDRAVLTGGCKSSNPKDDNDTFPEAAMSRLQVIYRHSSLPLPPPPRCPQVDRQPNDRSRADWEEGEEENGGAEDESGLDEEEVGERGVRVGVAELQGGS